MRTTLVVGFALIASILMPGWGFAETFDYKGRAIVACACPSPSQAGNCGNAGRQLWNYTVTIFVQPDLSVDENDVCFRRRDTTLCCPDDSSKFKGAVTKKCHGDSPC
jgi:hypothetical protein